MESFLNKIFKTNIFTDNFPLFLISTIPLAIIIGPAISLSNILAINVLSIVFILSFNRFDWAKTRTIKLLIILYLYLIISNFFSIEPFLSLSRNIGFLRFIFLFIFINYFFSQSSNTDKIFKFYTIIMLIVILDVMLESIIGKNILGYGENYGNRIMSFFKDEPIVGSFLNGFFLMVIGYLHLNYKNYSNNKKLLVIFFSILFLVSIILTGERANAIKAFLGFILFYILNDNFSKKIKLMFFPFIFLLISVVFFSSDYLKTRYGQGMFKQVLEQVFAEEEFKKFYKRNLYPQHYYSGFRVFINNPILGVGNKNYRIETCNRHHKYSIERKGYLCSTHPHQVYIEFLSEHGIIGTIILLSILFYLIFRILKVIIRAKNYLQLGCFIYLILVFIPLMPSGSFFSDFNATMFWLNLSFLYATNKKTNIFSNNSNYDFIK
jgi:hypothetical protein